MRDSKGRFIKGNIEPNKYRFPKGEAHYSWKGEQVSYSALHHWIVRTFGKADVCEDCETQQGRIEWSNISGEYLRIRSDWRKRCVKCHRKADNHPFKKGIGLRRGTHHTKESKKLIGAASKKMWEKIKERSYR